MTTKPIVKIFIDNTGHEDDVALGKLLKERILSLDIDIQPEIKTFTELDQTDYEDDVNNEANTIKAIKDANIVISVISTFYITYVTKNIESAINSAIRSSDKYFFPVLLDEADWSNHDWIVKSQVTPEDAKPLSYHSENDRQKIIVGLVKKIRTVMKSLSSSEETQQLQDTDKQTGNENIVFISHDHDDADFAELLKLKLEKENIISWIDTERLKIGQDWREEIDQGIENCSAVIAIMTPEARKSEYVTYEWAFAWGKGKHIFPIMLKQTQLHPRLESLQYLNFTNHPSRPWEELIDSIKKVVGD